MHISVSPHQLLPDLSVRRFPGTGRSYVPRNKAMAGVCERSGATTGTREKKRKGASSGTRGKRKAEGVESTTGHLPWLVSPQGPRLATIPFPLLPLPISHLPTMSFHPFPCDPPTAASLADARRLLNESNSSLADLDRKIEAAEGQLAQIVAESRSTIKQLQRERAALEEKISRTLAYMSPIRRLPAELLRHIFMM